MIKKNLLYDIAMESAAGKELDKVVESFGYYRSFVSGGALESDRLLRKRILKKLKLDDLEELNLSEIQKTEEQDSISYDFLKELRKL